MDEKKSLCCHTPHPLHTCLVVCLIGFLISLLIWAQIPHIRAYFNDLEIVIFLCIRMIFCWFSAELAHFDWKLQIDLSIVSRVLIWAQIPRIPAYYNDLEIIIFLCKKMSPSSRFSAELAHFDWKLQIYTSGPLAAGFRFWLKSHVFVLTIMTLRMSPYSRFSAELADFCHHTVDFLLSWHILIENYKLTHMVL